MFRCEEHGIIEGDNIQCPHCVQHTNNSFRVIGLIVITFTTFGAMALI